MDVVVENLTKSFGYQKAVDSVSFEVKKGEILGFLGPNGAGKTTTLKIMSCFLFPDYGNIRIGKYSIHKNPYKIKQIIGYLPEHNPLYEEMNVIDFLDFIARVHNIPKYKIIPKVMDMIRMCGLDNEKHKTIRELSKGYRQRVGLAQALIHDPEVLLLDEPTTGLDPNQIVEISADGTSAELRNKSDKGKLLKICIQGGEDEDIYNELALIPELENIISSTPHHFEIQCERATEIEKKIFDICCQNNWYISEMTPVETRLEDIFRQVTKN